MALAGRVAHIQAVHINWLSISWQLLGPWQLRYTLNWMHTHTLIYLPHCSCITARYMRQTNVALTQLNSQRQLNFEIAFIKPLESNNQPDSTQCQPKTDTERKREREIERETETDEGKEALTLKAAAANVS